MRNLKNHLLLLIIALSILLSFSFSVEKVAAQTQEEITACAVTCMDNNPRLQVECKFGNRYRPFKSVACETAYDNCSSFCENNPPAAFTPPSPTPTLFPCEDQSSSGGLQFSCFPKSQGCPVNWSESNKNPDTACDLNNQTCCFFNPPPTPISSPRLVWKRIAFCPTPTRTPTNTPTPVSATPAPTATITSPQPTPTPTLSPSQLHRLGDANNDSSIDIIDYNIWLKKFAGGKLEAGENPDFNDDGKVDILDYNRWLVSFVNKIGSRPR